MLSEMDRKIIKELQKDGRKSFSDLSKMFGLSVSTLRRRVNSLIENGVINITAIPDPTLVGYGINVVIFFKVVRTEFDSVIREICKDRFNHLVAQSTGPYDVISWSLFKDVQELTDYLTNRIPKIPGIVNTETSLLLGFAKRTYGWIDLEDKNDSTDGKPESNK